LPPVFIASDETDRNPARLAAVPRSAPIPCGIARFRDKLPAGPNRLTTTAPDTDASLERGAIDLAGYSKTPLAKKLGIREHDRVLVRGAPENWRELLAPLPESVQFVTRADRKTSLVHIFTKRKAELAQALARYRKQLDPEAAVWVFWPKKSAKVATDITEDVVREVALPLGFVDIKVCAIDEIWSGLKLVVRKNLR
jgi:hypothetical protein